MIEIVSVIFNKNQNSLAISHGKKLQYLKIEKNSCREDLLCQYLYHL